MVEPYQALGLVPTMRGIRHCGRARVDLRRLFGQQPHVR